MPGRLKIVVFLLAATSAVTPCAAQFQWPFGPKKNNAANNPTATPSVSSTAPDRPPATGRQDPYFTQRHPALKPGTPKKENPISAAWKKATQSVGDALTIKPKVIPAADATHLSTDPGPVGPDLYLSAARLMESRGQPAAAVVQYEKALSIDANHLPSLLGLGRLHHREGRMDDAIRTCLRATQAHPQSAIAYNDLGLCYSRLSRVESAIKTLSTAVELEPDSKLYRNNLAAALVQAGRHQEALSNWTHVHGTAVAHYNLGYLLYKQGKKDAAREQFQLALEQDPPLRQAAQMLARLRPPPSSRRSRRLPGVIHAPPATPAPTRPPVANRAVPPSDPTDVPPVKQIDKPSPSQATAARPSQEAPHEPPATLPPSRKKEPVVDTLPKREHSTNLPTSSPPAPARPATAPTAPAPVIQPEDYRASRFSGSPVSDTLPHRSLPTPPARPAPVGDPLIDRSPLLDNVQMPADTQPMPGVPHPTDRPRRFSAGTAPTTDFQPFSPQREPLPVFAPQSPHEVDSIHRREPAGRIRAIDPPAAEQEPLGVERDPLLEYMPRPLPSKAPAASDHSGPAAAVEDSRPVFLGPPPPGSDGKWERDPGYVRLKSEQAPATPPPLSPTDARPALRLPGVETAEGGGNRAVAPPLPPDGDAGFLPSTTRQLR